MADENRNELNAIVNLLGEMMVRMEVQHRETVSVFDRGFTHMVDKLTAIETKLTELNNHRFKDLEERVTRLEQKQAG